MSSQKEELRQSVEEKKVVINRTRLLGTEISEKISKEKRGNCFVTDRYLLPVESGQISALSERFVTATMNCNPEEVLIVWGEISQMVESRTGSNREKSVSSSEDLSQQFFEQKSREFFPNIKMKKRDGKKVISTYEGGIESFVKKKVRELVMNMMRKKGGEDLSKIFDDGFVLDSKGMTIYNAETKEGNSSERELIPWTEMMDLSFSEVSPEVLRGLNRIRRDWFSQPEPIAPVGLIRIFERTGQGSDSEIPDKARVLVQNPKMWVEGLNKIKESMSKRMRTRQELAQNPIYYRDFSVLPAMLQTPLFKRDRLLRQAENDYNQALEEWSKMPEERRRR